LNHFINTLYFFPRRWIFDRSGESAPFKDLSNIINTGNNDDISSLSASANAQQLMTSCILLGVVETSRGGEPQMPKNKRGNMLESDMHKWINRRKMNYLKSVVKSINKRNLN
jgi:hypothetical protein